MSDLIYGPNTEQVTAFIERCKVLTGDEIEKIAAWSSASWGDAWYVAWEAARLAAWDSIWYAAWDAAWDAAACDPTRLAAAIAARTIVVMDLITAEQFAILTEPFAEILVELGIVWKASESVKTEFTK